MSFLSLRALAVAGAFLVGGAAAAEPIHVEYLVDQKAFKAGAVATNPLNFELFSDDQCTALLGSAQLFAGDSAAQFFVDKRQRIKAAPKRPKAVRIQAVIDGPVAASAPYLKVTGTGVVPVGGSCQIQAGSAVGSGPSGPAGAAGPAGADGAMGPQGDSGPAGADGAAGAQGPQGSQGDPGPAGPAGVDGAAGAQGPQGDPGLAGPAGADGAVGPQGPQGDAGSAGPAGADGAVGPQGDPGPAGADGAVGPQGDPGPAGADGAVGPQGTQGDPGPAGADGAVGLQGPQGDPGPAGPAGADGAVGPAGADGADGAAGPAGTSGSLLGGNYSNLSDNNFLAAFDPVSGTEDNASLPVSAGTASRLVVRLPAALGAGSSVTLTLRKNGADTALTCTVPAASNSCTDLVNSVSFANTDLLSVRYNEVSNPNTRVRFSILYQAQ